MARRFRRGKPFQAGRQFPKPPPQYYDPQFDQEERASARGLLDLRQDISRAGTRDTVDYTLGRADIGRQFGEGVQDIARQRARSTQDYATNVAGLNRAYGQRARQQTQSAAAAGVGGGGALAQALLKRTENYQIDRKPLDTGYQRNQADLATSAQRLYGNTKTSLGRLALSTQRAAEDRTTKLSRAEREDKFFKTDVAESRFRAAQAAGWTGSGSAPHGVRTRYGVSFVKSHAHPGYYKLASGRYVNRQQLRSILRRHSGRG